MSVRILDGVTRKIERVFKGHSDEVLSVAFSHDGTRVASGSKDKTVRIWNVTTGKTKRSLRFWKAATSKAIRVLNGHSSYVQSVAFSPDGTRIVSGSDDKTVRLWNAGTGEIERVIEDHSNHVHCVAFSPDGTCMVSSSSDSVLIWDITTGKSTSLRASESFVFPDKSKVTNIDHGEFQLLAADQVVSLSRDRKWILTDRPNEACWIPPECRKILSHAISGSRVCLGYNSGRVVTVDLRP